MTTTPTTTAATSSSVEENSILARFAARTRRARKSLATGTFLVL